MKSSNKFKVNSNSLNQNLSNSKITNRIINFINILFPDFQIDPNYIQSYVQSNNITDNSEQIAQTALTIYDTLTNKPELSIKEDLTKILMEPYDAFELGTQLHKIKEIKKKQKRQITWSSGKQFILSSKHSSTRPYNLTNFVGLTSLLQFARAMNPSSIYKKAYVTLDSKYARFLERNTKLQWDYLDVLTESDTSTNTVSKIRDVVRIQIFSTVITKFSSPLMRGTTLIEEFRSQAFIAPNGRRFHTMGLLNDLENPIPIEIRSTFGADIGFTPDVTTYDKYELLSGFRFNEGMYYFNQPITTFNSLTLSFGNPFDLINIRKHVIQRCKFESINYNSLATWPDDDYFGNFDVDLQQEHFYTGEIYSIKISGFTTSDPITDALFIEYVNNMEFTYTKVLDSTRMRIYPRRVRPPGTHPVTVEYIGFGLPNAPTGNPSEFTMTFTGFRIITNIEFLYIDPNFGSY